MNDQMTAEKAIELTQELKLLVLSASGRICKAAKAEEFIVLLNAVETMIRKND